MKGIVMRRSYSEHSARFVLKAKDDPGSSKLTCNSPVWGKLGKCIQKPWKKNKAEHQYFESLSLPKHLVRQMSSYHSLTKHFEDILDSDAG